MNAAPRPYRLGIIVLILMLLTACGGGTANNPTAAPEQPTTSGSTAIPTTASISTEAAPSAPSPQPTLPPAAAPTVVPTVVAAALPEPIKGVKFGPLAYSPDGKTLAFVGSVYDQSTGYSDSTLYVKPIEGVEARAITKTSRRLILTIAFSPDNASIAYFVQETGTYVVAVEGEATPKEVKNVTCLNWSPDSKGLISITKGAVNFVPIDGGQPKTLFKDDITVGCAAYSPDGQSIAYLGKKDAKGFPQLYVSAPDGSNARPVSGDNNWGLFNVMWSPDGKRLAYFVTDVTLNGDIPCIAEVESGSAVCLKDVAGKYYTHMAWSPDSQQVALASLGQTMQKLRTIEVMPAASMTSTLLIKGDPFVVNDVTWNPANDQIVFAAVRASSNGGSIYAITPDGKTIQPIWGGDLVALGKTLVDFTYTIDSTTKLLFQRPKSWFFNSTNSILIFAPSQAALQNLRLPFEAQFGIAGGIKHINTVYKSLLTTDLSPRTILQEAIKNAPGRPSAETITEKILGAHPVAEIVFTTPNNEEQVLIAVNLDGYPVVVQFIYERGQGDRFLAMAEASVSTLRKE